MSMQKILDIFLKSNYDHRHKSLIFFKNAKNIIENIRKNNEQALTVVNIMKNIGYIPLKINRLVVYLLMINKIPIFSDNIITKIAYPYSPIMFNFMKSKKLKYDIITTLIVRLHTKDKVTEHLINRVVSWSNDHSIINLMSMHYILNDIRYSYKPEVYDIVMSYIKNTFIGKNIKTGQLMNIHTDNLAFVYKI